MFVLLKILVFNKNERKKEKNHIQRFAGGYTTRVLSRLHIRVFLSLQLFFCLNMSIKLIEK